MSSESEIQTPSIALLSFVGTSDNEFFDRIWQRACRVYRYEGTPEQPVSGWNDDRVKDNPFQELIRNSWAGLVDILEEAQGRYKRDKNEEHDPSTMLPLVFSERQTLPAEHVQSVYGGAGENLLFMAYLDGCSIVLNHADWLCPYLAALCLDLQKSFPHAYANAYLTPPSSQAVPPHADDRDVLVIQLVGEKHWKVYERIPIPFPYPDEQVGKEGLIIPPDVLEGPCVVDTILKSGDVLYMPRGFVHEARTLDSNLSFHATIALATHDWTLGRIITTAVQQTLDSTVHYRRAIEPISLGMQPLETVPPAQLQNIQQQVHDALEVVKKRLTVESISRHLENKYARHNQRALPNRMKRIHEARFATDKREACSAIVGIQAAHRISLQSIIRAATPQEKARALEGSRKAPGLHVRPETSDAIMTFLGSFKSDLQTKCKVSELPRLLNDRDNALLCDLTLLSFAKCCVEMGALAIVSET